MSDDTKYPYQWMRERRREQNARAKRRSRQRQKAQQEAGLEVVKQSEGQLGRAASTVSGPLCHVSSHPAIVSDLENVAKILDAEQLGIASILKYGIISMGGALDNHLFDLANQTCFGCWLELVESELTVPLNIGLALYSGVRRLSQMKGPPRWSIEAVGISTARRLSQIEPKCSDLRTIKLTSFSSTSAFLENAKQLGLSLGDFVNDDSESPFCSRYQPISYHTLAADLQPTPEQLKFPHHPYLDIVPFPSFRARALTAISSGTPAFSEDELCFDLAHDSMRCWGSTATSLHGRGNGTPWDARSWEVSPWFLKKWGFLVGNEDDAIYQNSLWWWSQR
ncbi:hypothetical protein ANOM_007366 [Aspergillus nomiae NRRL 13137]|uniref:BZIP domain-containing protein n=1 Tax=Aspergillus nomiae NRRL (strain ATCC 15546 / NRRL 13137 / CBS 260.88 / M93) TaxID=1509407 RepID=A0A0L1IWH1_ASPN3|nr:uncharacterized protein ANOM_007366 [Aspergillus nomiae NRRL 13137]KNG83842.1 hypothetical protein ANOM_007366 [Aspergillus nomiae NRRL 13137]